MTNAQTSIEEFIFQGTPDDFKRLYQGDELYELFREMNKRAPHVPKSWNPFHPSNDHLDVQFYTGSTHKIAVKAESDNTSRIIVELNGKSISWEVIKSKLINQGLLEQEREKTKRKPGRPHCPDDVWAWEEIHKHGRNAVEVYKEWAGRPGVKARNLIDLDRQFKRISKPGWMKYPGQNI